MPFSHKPAPSSSKAALSPRERKLVHALQRLVEDLVDANEHRNIETGEVYSSVKFAVETLRQIAGSKEVLSDKC